MKKKIVIVLTSKFNSAPEPKEGRERQSLILAQNVFRMEEKVKGQNISPLIKLQSILTT